MCNCTALDTTEILTDNNLSKQSVLREKCGLYRFVSLYREKVYPCL